MEQEIQYHLEDFDGPLDLLLSLVQKNKKSIYEIEIVVLIDQYLTVMSQLENGKMEATGEFVTMAARLVNMKSYLLLPHSEDAERMKEELRGLLVEYSACKAVASQLKEMASGVFLIARKPAEIKVDTTYTGKHDISELLGAFSMISGRKAAKRMPKAEQFDPLVSAPVVSVIGRVIYLLRGLTGGGFTSLQSAFSACRHKGEAVATFLALLELIRSGRVEIDAKENLSLNKLARGKDA